MTESVGPDRLRVGDRERDAAARLLAAHLAAGRLDPDEHAERVGSVLAARTRGDLRANFRDLPPPVPATPRPVPPALRLPRALLEDLAGEGLLVLEESLRGSTTYHRYRAPGEYMSWAREPLDASVALTWRRIVVWSPQGKRVDVAIDHPLRAAVVLTVEKADLLSVDCDAGAFHRDRTGRIVYRLRTPSATTIRDLYS